MTCHFISCRPTPIHLCVCMHATVNLNELVIFGNVRLVQEVEEMFDMNELYFSLALRVLTCGSYLIMNC